MTYFYEEGSNDVARLKVAVSRDVYLNLKEQSHEMFPYFTNELFGMAYWIKYYAIILKGVLTYKKISRETVLKTAH